MENIDSLIHLVMQGRQVDLNLPAIKYGIENECVAADVYTNLVKAHHSNMFVNVCGMYIDEQLTFLCASPDRVISCDCCDNGLLEIKCPFSSAGMHPKDAKLKYLTVCDDKIILNRNHKYYTQVQMQMAVTKRQWCDFFVYSTAGHILERVYFDVEFWEKCADAFSFCFSNAIVPNIICSC